MKEKKLLISTLVFCYCLLTGMVQDKALPEAVGAVVKQLTKELPDLIWSYALEEQNQLLQEALKTSAIYAVAILNASGNEIVTAFGKDDKNIISNIDELPVDKKQRKIMKELKYMINGTQTKIGTLVLIYKP